MSEQPPALGKGLFGYRRKAVNQLLSDRDVMLRQAEGRVRAAEAKVAQLENDLAAAQRSESQANQTAEQAAAAASSQAEVTTRFLNEELATILSAAEEAATRIVERARASSQEQVAEAHRIWGETQSQISRFAEWRERIDPVLRSAQAKIEEVRGRIEEVPDQIRQALSPLAEAVASLDSGLARVSGAGGGPRLSIPKDVDEATGPGAIATDAVRSGDDVEVVISHEVDGFAVPDLEAERPPPR
jgi:chromosome segregation ATPase